MKPLPQRITEANALLASYAVPLQGTLGRPDPEPEDDTRFPFQRDRDRIIHSQAFRRLQGKTQVFVAGEGDHYRTRLTHTMEVAQISRDIARTLSLNEDLAECIALAHDLGHPPFAHMGEQALDAWMKRQGSNFEHNAQSLRIVTLLEEHSARHRGLNLHREILEGMQKHGPSSDRSGRSLSLEAQLVNLADEIAYSAHDCDDGLRAKLFTPEELSTMELADAARREAAQKGTGIGGALIHLLVTDLYAATDAALAQGNIGTLADVYESDVPLVTFTATTSSSLGELQAFLHERMYAHPRVRNANVLGQDIIVSICDDFLAHPPEKVLALQRRAGGTLADAVKDYVAGMTDAYAKAML